MTLDDTPPGYPFDGDYTEYDCDEACGPLRDVIDRQAGELAQLAHEPWARRRLIAAAQRRRAGNPDLVQFDVLPKEVGFDTLLARGEILITAAAYRDAGARQFLDTLGMREQPLGCEELASSVVRVTNPEVDAQTLADAAKLLRQRGFVTSV